MCTKKYLLPLSLLLLLVACSDDYDEELGFEASLTPRYLSVSPTDVYMAAAGGSNQLEVGSIGTPWAFTGLAPWLSLSDSTGTESKAVALFAQTHTSADAGRVAVIYLNSTMEDWPWEQPIAVTQFAATPYLSIQSSDLLVSGAAGRCTLPVSSNCEWAYYYSGGTLTPALSREGNNLIVEYPSNPYGWSVYTYLYVYNSTLGVSHAIKLQQLPASVTATTDELVFPNTASQLTLEVQSEADWTATASETWMEVSPAQGTAGTSTLTIEASANTSTEERTGQVVLSVGELNTYIINIRQRGLFLEVTPTELVFVAAGEQKTLEVLSNTSWDVLSKPDWLTLSAESGEGNATLTLTAADNPNMTSRTGSLVLGVDGLTITAVVQLSQAAKYFDVGAQALQFTDKASSATIEISTDAAWQATPTYYKVVPSPRADTAEEPSWIAVSPASGTGSAEITVSVTENTLPNVRRGAVRLTVGDGSEYVEVRQQGKYFTVENTLLEFGSTGDTMHIFIDTNDGWTATFEGDVPWLSLSQTSGTHEAEISVTAADNPSVNSRGAVLLLKTSHNQEVRVVIRQAARYLRANTAEVLFYARGGEAQPITVSTDGTFSAEVDADWLTLQRTNNVLTLTASENKEREPRVAWLKIALTDLQEGSYELQIPVTQLNKGGSFIRYNYGDESDWDSHFQSGGTISFTGFGDDNNWNTMPQNNVTLTILGYGTDNNWNDTGRRTLTVTREGYKPEGNWNPSTTAGVDVGKDGFGNDKNLGGHTGSNGSVSKEGFGDDKDFEQE